MDFIANVERKEVSTIGWSGSPGLVVKGRDSRSEGRGFESLHHILDGHFFLIYLL